ncbi:MAG: hypothetical protein U5N53_05190 [Mycobacterium sp.]|nr:hypothetical protein [Mycobacterium sp.]
MGTPFIGPEALHAGTITRGQLRWRYAAAHPRVYVDKDDTPTLSSRIIAAWLWSGRRAVIAGRAAAYLHGAKWVDARTPIELITEHGRKRPGVVVREEKLADDEICRIGDLDVTTPDRTALDLARFLDRDPAVAHLDDLAAATGVNAIDVLTLASRYAGLRGIRRARVALGLMDAGSQSPRETWLRLLLIDARFPTPRTQIRVTDGVNVAHLDMGYDELRVGFDYDGAVHQTDRRRFVHDIGRAELIEQQGWIDIHVVAEHSRAFILHRARQAFSRRGAPLPPFSTSGR